MTQPHQRIDAELKNRRADLDVSWEAIASAAGTTTANLRSYRAGRTHLDGPMARKVEDAVGWDHGSVERIYAGKKPRVIGPGLATARAMRAESLVAVVERARRPGETFAETVDRLDRASKPALPRQQQKS